MGVVPLVGLVLDVGDGDRDAARPLLGSVVDLVERLETGLPLEGEGLGDRRREGRLAVIHMPDRPHIDMRLRPLKLRLAH
jgi:hypothetical protein